MIHYNDLQTLKKLFFENVDHCIVFDPFDSTTRTPKSTFSFANSKADIQHIVNQRSDQKILIIDCLKKKIDFNFNQSNIVGSIHFNNLYQDKNTTTFQYINNPDESIRWFFPSTNSHPAFLQLYNNSGWKASAYRAFMHLSYGLNCSSLVTSGSFSINTNQNTISRFFNGKAIDDYAIFTGTAGKNRKTIMALFQKRDCSHFVKIPLTENAHKLVQHEQEQLERIEKLQLNKMVTPKKDGDSKGLCLTNIQPFDSVKAVDLNEKHLTALKECYSKTHDVKHPTQLSAWQQIVNGIDFLNTKHKIQNNLSKEKVKKITAHLNMLFDQVKNLTSFPVGLAHGDFTPWNMYETKDKIHVYDWEMACSDMPLFFDAFHYVFQNSILTKQQSFTDIKKQLDNLSKDSIINELTNQYKINWSDHYAFYMLYITSYYLPQYIQQKDLHEQAHWLVDYWAEALAENAVATRANVAQEAY